MTTLDDLSTWMQAKEDEHLEFKEAKTNFHFEELVKYCVALANEGGGRFILGVTDKKPRKIVGSQAFTDIERTKSGIVERLHLRVDAEELNHPNGRVLVFHVPSRPLGVPIQYQGAYWMRAGESLVAMTQDLLKRIFDESGPDYSAEICPRATVDDLDTAAIAIFREKWNRKTGNPALLNLTNEQLLRDAELIINEDVTYAALVLLGKHDSLGRLMGQAEVIYEVILQLGLDREDKYLLYLGV